MLKQDDRGAVHRNAELTREAHWRNFQAGQDRARRHIVASRWVDERRSVRRERAVSPPDRWVLSVALRSTVLRFSRGPVTLAEGRIVTGMLHLTAPAQLIEAEFGEPCDFIHFYISADYVAQRAAEVSGEAPRYADVTTRDPVAAQLGRTLVESNCCGSPVYEESVGQTIVTRLLMGQPPPSRVNPLPKWRLRRVRDFAHAQIGERITLNDLAAAAGLSRMHFAAQFRAAVGCRPHDYLVEQRIECAKAAMIKDAAPLAQVALSVGFQTQSHFSTVFKRMTGESPAQWRRAQQPTLVPRVGRCTH